MKLTAITATTPERHDAFALCKNYLARQTRQPDQWLVLDGPEPMHEKVARAIAEGRVEGEAIVFFEDDDWVRHTWFEWCEYHLSKGYDIVGQGRALFYNVRHRWWNNCGNVRHASLCQTAIRRSLLPHCYNIIEDFGCPWIDVQLWNVESRKYLHLPAEDEMQLIGIKGLCGSGGYSREHRMVNGAQDDNTPDYDLIKLRSLIGDDADSYARFFEGEDEILKLAGAYTG
jgi:hypothetical protein